MAQLIELDPASQLDFSGVVLKGAVEKICLKTKELLKNKRSLQVLDLNQIKTTTKRKKMNKKGKENQGKTNLKAKKKINKGDSVHERIDWRLGEMKKMNKMKNIVPNFYFST